MKKFIAIMFVALSMLSTNAFAGSSSSSPLIGSWSVDLSRLPMPPDVRPKSVTIIFNETEDGKWGVQVKVIAHDGSESHAIGSSTLDGKASPVEGNLEADSAALKMPMPNVLIMMLSRESVPMSTRIYAAAADGQSMVETAAYFDEKGNPVMRTNYFTRLR